jgi:hypothetical protein
MTRALYQRVLVMYLDSCKIQGYSPGRETEPHYNGREKGSGQNQRPRAACG